MWGSLSGAWESVASGASSIVQSTANLSVDSIVTSVSDGVSGAFTSAGRLASQTKLQVRVPPSDRLTQQIN